MMQKQKVYLLKCCTQEYLDCIHASGNNTTNNLIHHFFNMLHLHYSKGPIETKPSESFG